MLLPELKKKKDNSSVPTRAGKCCHTDTKVVGGKRRANDSERSDKSHKSAAYGGNKGKERA